MLSVVTGNLAFHSVEELCKISHVLRDRDLPFFIHLVHFNFSLKIKKCGSESYRTEKRESLKLSPNELSSNRLSHTILKQRLALFPKHVVSKLYAEKRYNIP